MRLKTGKKMVSVFLLLTMLVFVFAGCAKQGSESAGQEEAGKQTASAQPEESKAEETSGQAESSEPEEVVSLDFFVPNVSISGPITGWMGDYLRENGLEINVINGGTEKTQAYLAGGELPDVVCFMSWDEVQKAIEGNMLVNLDEHLDQLPNVTANLGKALDYSRDARSNGTNNLYAIPASVGTIYYTVNPGVYAFNIRWDLYEKIGCPKAEKLEDLIPIFKQMQEIYPETEDGSKTYALNMFSDWAGSFSMMDHVYASMGYQNASRYFVEVDDQFNAKSIFEDDSMYLRALKFFYQLNQEGLLDPDSVTQTYETSRAKIDAGAYLAVGFGGYYDSFNTEERINADEPVGYMPIIFGEYKAAVAGNNPVGSTKDMMAVSASTTKLDACLKLLNMFADYDTILTLYNGPQGELWDVDADGNAHVTDNYWKNSSELSNGEPLQINAYSYLIQESSIHPEYNVPLKMGYWPEVIERTQNNKLAEAWAKDNDGYMFPIQRMEAEGRLVYKPLAASLMESIPNDLDLLDQTIKDKVDQLAWLMMFAEDEDEFNALWEEMKESAEAMDAEEVISWYINAWNTAKEVADKYE